MTPLPWGYRAVTAPISPNSPKSATLSGTFTPLPLRQDVGWHNHHSVRAGGQLVVVQAYILIQTEVGKAAEVAREISEIEGVTLAEDVTGPYDVIVRAEADNVDDLGKLVVARVQGVEGITRTLTCPVVHL
ncbi:Lrp/AsnC family transcriptional regulator [Phytoactinopolyspora halotolerans]|uniref:Lrp/AsnC family transcriptional regulator n=1 Tax=Phytoactinopolyspora halotolerans TaxID=1981512 RepID=A0A6L9SEV6_9ACTN|nr:Lrp/AsnC family transcriptional regulator [Phytoactinopolyspora halotolerans]